MSTLAKQFGNEVRTRRKARGLTQAQLAEASSLSEEWVRRIERGSGSPSFDSLDALSRALKCNVADLFTKMSPHDAAGSRVDALLTDVPAAELSWLEELIRVAVRHPQNGKSDAP